MVKSGPPSPICTEDYEAIQTAVMETARGRWFLTEYARHNRTADTEMLLGAIEKLHGSLIQQEEATDTSRIKNELMDIAGAIANTKQEIAAMGAQDGGEDRITTASIELDAIVTTAEKATGDILNYAEQIQEIAWTLRENGIDESSCAALDNHATEIYTACSFQDLTGQRTQKIIKILAFIDRRIEAMTDIWNPNSHSDTNSTDVASSNLIDDTRPDAHLLNGPQIDTNASNQDEVDDVLAGDFYEETFAVDDEVEILEPAPLDVADPEHEADLEIDIPNIDDTDDDAEDFTIAASTITNDEVTPDPPGISASADNADASTVETAPETADGIADLSDSHKLALFS
jgi:chemotaxis protein CheZ